MNNQDSPGEINFCACMGPMYDEPYCYCEMLRRGLPLNNAERQKSEDSLRRVFKEIFGDKDDNLK
jgi:hypothetical protein